MQLIECVPNFSEGNNQNTLNQIAAAIRSIAGIKLLNIDAGKATNRTVFTFVGEPQNVIDAAFLAIKTAAELIDMTKHQGEHARIGATDVCPLIPIANISMAETAQYAHLLAQKVGTLLHIPVFMYEQAATKPERQNLATIRAGEYEQLAQKLQDPNWKPDYGEAVFNAKSGATVIGARDFLVAYNLNLNTQSVRLANAVAFDVREAGRVKREGHPITGKILKDENGEPQRTQGTLKHVKAVGWYIAEYGIAQVSMNLTNTNATPLHTAFEACIKSAESRGLRVTGSELVGLVPLKVLTDAGTYFLHKQNRSAGVSEQELIHIAIKSLGLDELKPFDPKERIIEYQLKKDTDTALVSMTLTDFANLTASETPAPGGGSVSALVGALAASLTAMVANLSANKRGWEHKTLIYSQTAQKTQHIKDTLMRLVDEDAAAFEQVMIAFALPKETQEAQKIRKQALEQANKTAMQVPFQTMKTVFEVFELIDKMIEEGNPNSITDVGVAALCAKTAVYGAFLNVKINASGIGDKVFVENILSQAEGILFQAIDLEQKLIDKVIERI